MNTSYLKIPVEMAIFSLRETKYKQVSAYIALQFLYSGKVKIGDQPVKKVSNIVGVSEPTGYRYFRWLLSRNWIGKDNKNGWYHFRGLDQIHAIEGWQFARAAKILKKDLKNIKAFMTGAVCASLVQTGKGQRTEPIKGGSEQAVGLISLSTLSDTLKVSTKTAYRLRKLADKCNYIESMTNLVEITNWRPNDLIELKKQGIKKLPVKLLGYPKKKARPIERIRYKNDKLFLQEPNKIKSLVELKSRKGLSKYQPPNPCSNDRQK